MLVQCFAPLLSDLPYSSDSRYSAQMDTPAKHYRIRFGLNTCFALIVLTAIICHFVLVPEIQRRNAFRTLQENDVICAPLVTLFGGRAPGVYDPVKAPILFKIRQSIAHGFFIQTEPWCENCILDFDRNDKTLASLVDSCEDLTKYTDRKHP